MFKSKLLMLPVAAYLAYRSAAPNKTTPVEGDNAIAELKMVPINGTKLAVMIRGADRNNPVLLCVAGGPCGTEIPIKKFDSQLEKHFTVVHYDQRGAGKSAELFKDYSKLTADIHVDDLLAMAEYICNYLNKEKVYLVGHSYGTYLSSLAVNKDPSRFIAYIGIGQMSDTADAEYQSLLMCIDAAKAKNNKRDVKKLESLKEKVRTGKMFTPRKYCRKYKFAEHTKTKVGSDLMKAVLVGPEYTLVDTFKYITNAMKYAMPLAMQAVEAPLSKRITGWPVPTFIHNGKYDGMTNTAAAKAFFDQMECPHKEFIVYENSAHSPQCEENEKYVHWMCNDLLEKTKPE